SSALPSFFILTAPPPISTLFPYTTLSRSAFEGKTFKRGEGPVPNIDFWQIVGDDAFETLGLRLIAGRFLDARDTADSMPAVVINEALARKFYPGEDPLGKRLKIATWLGDKVPWQTIVGVVADVKQQGLEGPVGTEAYIALRQNKVIAGAVERNLYVVAQGSVEPRTLQQVVARMDPTVPVYRMRTMDRIMY